MWLPLPLGSNRDWAAGLFVALVGLLAGIWALTVLRGALPLPRALRPALPMFVLLLLAQGWVAVQWGAALTLDVGATLRYLLLGLAYSLLFLLVVALFHERRRLLLLLAALVVSGTFQAFYGAFMTLSGGDGLLASLGFGHDGVVSGTYVNRNHLAGYLEMTLACGIGLLLALRSGRPFRWASLPELLVGAKAQLRLALLVMVVALVMSRSRMGNVAFFVSLLVVAVPFVLRAREQRRLNGLILASIVVVDVFVIGQYFGLERLKERILDTRFADVLVDGELQRGNELRDDVFVQALPLARQSPWTGQGAGSFEVAFPAYAGESLRAHFDHAHNDYLQFFVEYGLLGSLPLAAFVLLAFWHALRALWRRDSLFRSGLGFGAAMGILSIAIHSLTDFNLQIPANAATFVTLCAIAVLAGTPGRATTPAGRSHGADLPAGGAS
ncbi:O-antigen ligase family protein [Pseudomonas stutzeri]|nr:O-antigen ligase family protein [Stutzerimonas stutzeri]